MHVLNNINHYYDTNNLMASGGSSQATGAYQFDGGDRSGQGPGHAPPQYARDTVRANTSGNQFGPTPDYTPQHQADIGVQHSDESAPDYTPYHEACAGVQPLMDQHQTTHHITNQGPEFNNLMDQHQPTHHIANQDRISTF
jgi:hypothetical protein